MFDTRVQPNPHTTAAINLGDAARPVWVLTGSHGDTWGHSFPADQRFRWLVAFLQAGYKPFWDWAQQHGALPLADIMELFYACRDLEDRTQSKEQPVPIPPPEPVTRLHGNIAVEIDPYRLTENLPYWFKLSGSVFAIVREPDGALHLYFTGNPQHLQDLRAQEHGMVNGAASDPPHAQVRVSEWEHVARLDDGDLMTATATIQFPGESAPAVPVNAHAGEVGTYLTPIEWFQIRENVLHHLWTPSVDVVRLLLAEYDALLHSMEKVQPDPPVKPGDGLAGLIFESEWQTLREQVDSQEVQWFDHRLVGNLLREYDALFARWMKDTVS